MFIHRYQRATYNFFKWRSETDYINKLVLAAGFAVFTGLLAQVRLYLPFTPVPVTGQTFAVLLTGVMLGSRYGALSQGIYAALGFAGIPWFAGWRGGIELLTGVTAGYIAGFILAATVIGWFTDRYVKSRSYGGMLLLMLLGSAIILISGATVLALIMHTNLEQTLVMGVLPFIPGDIFKATLAAGIASALAPKEAFNSEVDAGYQPRSWLF